jgi:hypothetical protein
MKRMVQLALMALVWLPAAGGKAMASDDVTPIAYGCNEVVVVGRSHTIGVEAPSSEGDFLGHGRYAMQVTIKRVLRGKETRRVVPASGYSHGQMREDVDFWMVLVPAPSGYVVRTANLASIPYRLAPACGGVNR